MNREEYYAAVMELNKKPPMKKTPKGQKFNIGDKVRTIHGFWGDEVYEPGLEDGGFDSKGFVHPPPCSNKGRTAVIEYSYYQKFGDHSKEPNKNDESLKEYSIIFTDGKSNLVDPNDVDSSAWWEEDKLELI